MFGEGVDPIKNYETFVNHNIDNDEIKKIYYKDNIPAILGTKGFKGKILFQTLDQDQEKQQKTLHQINKNKLLKIDQIVDLVSDIFDVKTSQIINYNRGRRSLNIPRFFAKNIKI
ncbi:MAG: hypothetical protein ACI9TO_001189 [Rickettsiales bacterium]|jgi:hypothetical protein